MFTVISLVFLMVSSALASDGVWVNTPTMPTVVLMDDRAVELYRPAKLGHQLVLRGTDGTAIWTTDFDIPKCCKLPLLPGSMPPDATWHGEPGFRPGAAGGFPTGLVGMATGARDIGLPVRELVRLGDRIAVFGASKYVPWLKTYNLADGSPGPEFNPTGVTEKQWSAHTVSPNGLYVLALAWTRKGGYVQRVFDANLLEATARPFSPDDMVNDEARYISRFWVDDQGAAMWLVTTDDALKIRFTPLDGPPVNTDVHFPETGWVVNALAKFDAEGSWVMATIANDHHLRLLRLRLDTEGKVVSELWTSLANLPEEIATSWMAPESRAKQIRGAWKKMDDGDFNGGRTYVERGFEAPAPIDVSVAGASRASDGTWTVLLERRDAFQGYNIPWSGTQGPIRSREADALDKDRASFMLSGSLVVVVIGNDGQVRSREVIPRVWADVNSLQHGAGGVAVRREGDRLTLLYADQVGGPTGSGALLSREIDLLTGEIREAVVIAAIDRKLAEPMIASAYPHGPGQWRVPFRPHEPVSEVTWRVLQEVPSTP